MNKRERLCMRDRYHKAKAHLQYSASVCAEIRKATSIPEVVRIMEKGRRES